MKCQVCGHPIEDPGPRKQKLYHEPCKRLKNYLDAAVRAARDIDPKPDRSGATMIRQRCCKASNQISAIAQVRDKYGRFC